MHAAVYCRISVDRVGGGLGVERQELDCRRLAASLGWTVADVYIDNDISAYSGKRRPEYERLLDDISSGRVDGLLTWHLDRLNRSPLELERLIKVLERNDVIVQTVAAGVLDLASASGRAVARTLSAWARFESEHKSERMRAATMQRALAGAPAGGSFRPFGYGPDKLTLVPAEAKIVRELVRRLLAGTSLKTAASVSTKRLVFR